MVRRERQERLRDSELPLKSKLKRTASRPKIKPKKTLPVPHVESDWQRSARRSRRQRMPV